MAGQEKDEGFNALADALALAHSAMDQLDAPWASFVQQTLNAALGSLLNLHEAERLSARVIELQDTLIASAVSERDHWRANHDQQVKRARILQERTDVPKERTTAYEYMGDLQTALTECLTAARAFSDQNDGLYVSALGDPLAVPAYVRAQFRALGES